MVCKEHTDFSANDEKSEGTYTNYASLDYKLDGFHYYLGSIKFGIKRATSDTASQIRSGMLTREEGIKLVKSYDSEFAIKYLETFLKYCGITEDEFNDVIDCCKSDHLCEKVDSEWKLKYEIDK